MSLTLCVCLQSLHVAGQALQQAQQRHLFGPCTPWWLEGNGQYKRHWLQSHSEEMRLHLLAKC